MGCRGGAAVRGVAGTGRTALVRLTQEFLLVLWKMHVRP